MSKRRIHISAIAVTVGFLTTFVAIDPANADSFFPLGIGNTWFTCIPTPALEGQKYHEYKVVDTLRINDQLYYIVDLRQRRLFREDSVGRFYEYREGKEHVIMDFRMSKGDSIPTQNYIPGYYGYIYCLDRKTVNTFIGTRAEQIHFLMDWDSRIVDEEESMVLQQGAGLYKYYPFFDTLERLQGAIIDGIAYGDTTGVSIENKTPEHFILYPNTPNPFNMATRLLFYLATDSYVIINAYNLRGQQVEILYKQYTPRGFFDFKWNAGELKSGIYLIRYQADQRSFVQKCVLVQ